MIHLKEKEKDMQTQQMERLSTAETQSERYPCPLSAWAQRFWGSDALFMSAAHQIGRDNFADISQADKVRILGKNAQGLFSGFVPFSC